MNTYETWLEKDIVDLSGDSIGEVENIYVDTQSKVPTWLHVETGFFDDKYTYIPIEATEADHDNDRVVTAYEADFVKNAPHFDEDQLLSTAEERQLYEYYSLNYETGAPMTDDEYDNYQQGVAAGEGVVRSEEELSVDTQEVETGTVRLHKYVETENVDLTVPVRKEKVRVIREPAHGQAGHINAGGVSEEITLKEEVPVVDKKVVAKEKVSLEKDVDVDHAHINETVRKERVEVDGDVETDN
jgi:uncharacterized protein (TIGR02271 family)